MKHKKKFKILLIKRGIKQIKMAIDIGIDNGQFSRIVNGHLKPTQVQKKKICEYLGVNENVLF